MADMESFDDILNALSEVQRTIANVISAEKGKIQQMIESLENISRAVDISDIPELTGFEGIQGREISRGLQNAFDTLRRSFRALYSIIETDWGEELTGRDVDKSTFSDRLRRVQEAIRQRFENMFSDLERAVPTIAKEFNIPEMNINEFLEGYRNIAQRELTTAFERMNEQIRRQFETPVAFTERFIGDMESLIRENLGIPDVDRRRPEFETLRQVASQLQTALYSPQINQFQEYMAQRLPEAIDNIQNIFSQVEDIYTRQYQRQYELTKLETIKDVIQSGIESGNLPEQVQSVFQTAIRTITDEQNKILAESINQARGRINAFVQAHTKTFQGIGVQFEVGEFPPMEFDLVKQTVQIPDLFGRIGNEISQLLGEIEQGLMGISVGGLEDIFRTTINDIDTRMNQIRESIARQRERLELGDITEEERGRLRRRIEIEEATLQRLEENRNRLTELFPVLTGERQLSPQERFRFGTLEPLRESFQWLGQVSLQNLMFSAMLGSTMILFEALAMFPTQTAYQSLMPVYSVFGGMTGFTQLTQALQGFAYSVPAIIDQLQSYMNTITGITGSFDFTRQAIGTALEVARIEPIQFSEALEVLTAGTIYPELREGIRRPEFQRQLFETVQLLSILAPEQGVQGALFAIREMFGGNFRSLQLRFNIDPEIISQYAGADRSLREMRGLELIETLNRGLRNIFSGDEVLIRQGLQFNVQIRNIIDTLISSVIRPLLEPQQTLQEYVTSLISLQVRDGRLDTGFLELTAPNLADRLRRMYERDIEQGATPEEALLNVQTFMATTLGSPLQLLSFGLLQINNIIDQILQQSGITEAFGEFILGIANRMQDAILQYQYEATFDPQKAGENFAKNLSNIIKEGFVQFDTFLEQTGLSGIVREIADIGRTAMRTMFRDVMKEVFIGLGDVLYNLPADFTDAMIGILRSQVQSFVGSMGVIGGSIVDIFTGGGGAGLMPPQLQELGLSDTQIQAILQNQVPAGLVAGGNLVGQVGGLVQFGGLASIVATVARGIRENTWYVFKTYRELLGGALVSHIGQEMQAIGNEIQTKGVVDWGRVFGVVGEGLLTAFVLRGTNIAGDIQNIGSRIRVLPTDIRNFAQRGGWARFLGLTDIATLGLAGIGVVGAFGRRLGLDRFAEGIRRYGRSIFDTISRTAGESLTDIIRDARNINRRDVIDDMVDDLIRNRGRVNIDDYLNRLNRIGRVGAISSIGRVARYLGTRIPLIGFGIEFGSGIVEGQGLLESLARATITSITSFVGGLIGSIVGGFVGALAGGIGGVAGAITGGVAGGIAGYEFGQDINEFLFGSRIPEIEDTELERWDEAIRNAMSQRLRELNRNFERARTQGQRLVRYGVIDEALFERFGQNVENFNEVYTTAIEDTLKQADNLIARAVNRFNQRAGRQVIDEDVAGRLMEAIVPDEELRRTIEDIYNDIATEGFISVGEIRERIAGAFSQREIREIATRTGLSEEDVMTFISDYSTEIGNQILLNQRIVRNYADIVKEDIQTFNRNMFTNFNRYVAGFQIAQIEFPDIGKFDVNNIGGIFNVLQKNLEALSKFAEGVGGTFADIPAIGGLALQRGNIELANRMNNVIIGLANRIISTYGLEAFTTMLFQDRGFQQLFLPIISQTKEFDDVLEVIEKQTRDKVERFNQRLEKERSKLEEQGVSPDTGFRFEEITPEEVFGRELDVKLNQIIQRIRDIRANMDKMVELQISQMEQGLLQQEINIRAERQFLSEHTERLRELASQRQAVSGMRRTIDLDAQLERVDENIRRNIERAITGQFNIEGLTRNFRFIDPLLMQFSGENLTPNQLYQALSGTYARVLRMTQELNRAGANFGLFVMPNLPQLYSQMINTIQRSFGILPEWLTRPEVIESVFVQDLLAGTDIRQAMGNVGRILQLQMNRLNNVTQGLGLNIQNRFLNIMSAITSTDMPEVSNEPLQRSLREISDRVQAYINQLGENAQFDIRGVQTIRNDTIALAQNLHRLGLISSRELQTFVSDINRLSSRLEGGIVSGNVDIQLTTATELQQRISGFFSRFTDPLEQQITELVSSMNLQNMVSGINIVNRRLQRANNNFTQQILRQVDNAELQDFWAGQGLTVFPDFSIDVREFMQNPVQALTNFGKELNKVKPFFGNFVDYLQVGLATGLLSAQDFDKDLRMGVEALVENWNKLPETVRLDPQFFQQMYILAKAEGLDVRQMEESYKKGLLDYRRTFQQLDKNLASIGDLEKQYNMLMGGYEAGVRQVQQVSINAGQVIIKSSG